MAASTILSFTDLDGASHKIATVSIFSIQDNSSYRIIILSSPTGKLKTSSTLDTLKEEALSLFQATVNGKEFLFNSLLVSKLVDYNGVCQITWQGGSRTTTEETISVIESRIDNLDEIKSSLIPQGNWNASTNTPDITGVSTTGYYYIVSADGSTNVGGITDWKVNDWAVKTETGWAKVDNTDKVFSVNGEIGTVVLDADNIAATSTNKWLTVIAQTIVGVKTFTSEIIGTTIKASRPVGVVILSDKDLENVIENTFYDVNAGSNTVTITVTDQSNTDFAIGTEWEFSPIDISNNISFVAGGSTTINSVDGNLKLDKAFSAALLKKTANNTFKLIGTLKA